MLIYLVPRLRERSRAVSEKRSTLIGRVVDSYTNILTVKLFARALDEDAFVRDSVDEHTAAFRDQARMSSGYTIMLSFMNSSLVVGTATIAIWQWSVGHIAVAGVATAIPMSWQLTNIAGWVARSITAIFENIGTVQDGMRSIDVPRQMPDPPGARELVVHGGEIRFEDVHFDYGRQPRPGGVLRGIDLIDCAGRACRAGWSVRCRQIDAGQSAAAFLRPRQGSHPDRWPGHRARHARKSAHANRHGDAGHFAAASLNSGKHQLRPSQRDRRDGRGGRSPGRGA